MKHATRKHVLFEIFEILYHLHDLVPHGWFKMAMHKIQVYIESAFGIFCTLVFNSFRSSFNINISDNPEECIHVYPCANSVSDRSISKISF